MAILPRRPAAFGSTCWYQPWPHSAPSFEQLISMRRSLIALSPCRTPVIIRIEPSLVASRSASSIGRILMASVHQRRVPLLGGGTPRPSM